MTTKQRLLPSLRPRAIALALANWIFAEYPLVARAEGCRLAGRDPERQRPECDSSFRGSDIRPLYLAASRVWTVCSSSTRARSNFNSVSLALSVDPDVRRFAPTRNSDELPQFRRRHPRAQPGGGWSLAPQSGEPTLVRSGSIFLFNPVRQAVSLHVQSSSTTEAAHLVVEATTAGLGPTAVSSAASITMVLPPGITEVRVDPTQTAGATSPKVTGIAVSSASTA